MDNKSDEPRRVSADAVEVDIEHIAIPDGRWRVVTEHVPEKRLMITRFATLSEITAAHKRVAIDSTSRKRKILDVDDQGYSYSWSTEEKVRPGLNVFDDKGNELEWDYEHDTRFYEETKSINLDSKSEECGKDAPNAIKIKGRGVRKGGLLYGGSGSTLASDNIESKPLKRSFGRLEDTVDDVEEEDWEPDRRTSPTPQPWDKPRSRLTDRISRW
uniref:Agenet domain-containing protein n=1 Tax=Heterorhabditis bacteriophora TaxID=37862 RepID=A0A1I7XLH9_HETBA